MVHKNIAGTRFGKLVAVEIDSANQKRLTKWLCVCDCGKTSSAYLSNLVRGNTKSCGCSQMSQFIKHSMYGTKIYRVWGAMVQRCCNSNNPHFDRYGGRGIGVSEAWKEFAAFYADMGDANGMTLERIDNDLGYSKDNCKWATRKEQARNRSNTVIFTAHGKAMTVDEWSGFLGISRECLRGRIRRGWKNEDAFKK